MAGAADLEEDQALVLELDLLVVELPRQHHRAVGPQQVLAREAVGVRVLARVGVPLLTAVVPSCVESPIIAGARPDTTVDYTR